MERIQALDWGVYQNFGHTIDQSPELLALFIPAFYLSSYAGVSVIVLLAMVLFLLCRKFLGALVAVVCFALALGLFEAARFVVPRRRPENAANWLGADGMLGSYPSNVMLFMLGVNLLGYAVWDLIPAARWRSLNALLATVLTIWVCLSHMYLPIHFFSDVLGGLAAGALFSWLGYRYIGPSGPKPVSTPAEGTVRAG